MMVGEISRTQRGHVAFRVYDEWGASPDLHHLIHLLSCGVDSMPNPEPRLARGQLRVWLKEAIRSGFLDKLPPRYEAEGMSTSDPPATEPVARCLLAELQDPGSARRTLAEIVADVRRFQGWVQARRKHSRQAILAEVESANSDPSWLESWATAMTGATEQVRCRTPPRKIRSRSDPMWDEELDG
jgi:hypothetical protein